MRSASSSEVEFNLRRPELWHAHLARELRQDGLITFSNQPTNLLLIGIDLINLFVNQREYALPESENQQISLLNVVFEPVAALSG